MSFESCLNEQIRLHASMQPQDLVKLCYQAAYGPKHIIENMAAAKTALEKEFREVLPASEALYELISDDYIRINLSVWKKRALPSEWLFNMMKESAVSCEDQQEKLAKYLQTAERIVLPMAEKHADYISEYKKRGMPVISHSAVYKCAEHPAYRVINRRFVRILPIIEAISEIRTRPAVIAIDGRAASGKTTAAKALSVLLAADVVHMDDFFLPASLRTQERLQQPGGNIHYERFAEEVLPCIRAQEGFSYRTFSCDRMDYSGLRTINSKSFRIIEGSYSLHPQFGNYADVTVFSDVNGEEQLRRIRERDGEEYEKTFAEKWIPMEESYFEAFNIPQSCSLII